MSETLIRTDDLGKRYRLGETLPYRTLRESLRAGVTRPARRLLGRTSDRGDRRAARRAIWALRHVSLEIARGDVVGIIGRNGAGKSTLLKLLTRITNPTEGSAEVRGQIGSLLEVGTGFHPELTGRENVFLNGAILGMGRRETARKFDEIVAFSGVEDFLDTPVKRYSSGMRVRLAFAVAAHLEPEILVIDEVLAVGDAEFQKRCLGKMNDVAKGGRTVLFVSHNLAAVQTLCNRGILLHEGNVAFEGSMGDTIDAYLSATLREDSGRADLTDHPGRLAGMEPMLEAVAVRLAGADECGRTITSGEDLVLEITLDTRGRRIDMVQAGICAATGQRVTTVSTHLSQSPPLELSGRVTVECRLPELRLSGGDYTVDLMLGTRTPPVILDCIDGALQLRVEEGDYFGTGCALLPHQGALVQTSHWRVR